MDELFESTDNPYQSPAYPYRDTAYPSEEGQPFAPQGLATHVPAVAILMMVQGAVEIVVSLFFFLMVGVLPVAFAAMPAGAPGGGAQPGPPPAAFGRTLATVYAVMGLAAVLGGVLKVVGGWRNFRYRGRVLGIVALSSALASMLTCYCAPTAIALFVYGLIVHLSPETAVAFDQADSR
ncbi:MAG: hypothetical protein WD847_01225 [Pirellulales bacterium]